MTKKTASPKTERLIKINSICLSALVGVLGVLYIVLCAHLYFTGGDNPYSRERVGGYLLPLLPLSVLVVADVIFAAVMAYIYSSKESGYATDASYALMRSEKRIPLYTVEGECRDLLLKEKKMRIIYRSVAAAVTLVCAVVSIIVAADKSRYQLNDLNAEVLGAVAVFLPLMAVALGAFVVSAYLCEASAKKAQKVYSTALKEGKVNKDAVPVEIYKGKFSRIVAALKPVRELLTRHERKITVGLQALLGAVAIVFIILGIFNGGMTDVLAKAVKICTECIGLG